MIPAVCQIALRNAAMIFSRSQQMADKVISRKRIKPITPSSASCSRVIGGITPTHSCPSKHLSGGSGEKFTDRIKDFDGSSDTGITGKVSEKRSTNRKNQRKDIFTNKANSGLGFIVVISISDSRKLIFR